MDRGRFVAARLAESRLLMAISVAASVTLALCGPGGGPASAQQSYALSDVSFLTGCWAGQMGSLDMREQWTTGDGGMMQSTTKFIRDGKVVDFEFGTIVESEQGITLWPYPRGTISEHGFPLVRVGEEYVFENLEHDFPVRIIYVRNGPDSLAPRIEGNDGEGPSWRLQRLECPTA